MSKIDLVVPYVDSNDLNWQKLFDKYNPVKNKSVEAINAINRFRGQGDVFKYWFRCVEKNMPWINNIYLVVQSKSQVPYWLNTNKVKVVLHSEIIPEEFLPTFNSTTIEMFLWKIPDLAEKFIYSSDDFFAFNPMKPDDFFEGDKLKTNPTYIRYNTSMYVNHCANCYTLVYDTANNIRSSNSKFPIFKHSMRPYFKSTMKECFEKYEKEILDGISKFRETRNHNIYLFDYYNIKNNHQIPSKLTSICISSSTPDSLIKELLRHAVNHFIGIQDTDTSSNHNIYNNIYVTNSFKNLYPLKSKYEK